MTGIIRRLAGSCIALCTCATALPTSAATYCVTNVPELQAALSAAAASSADDEIKLQQGIYAASQQLQIGRAHV